MKAYILTVLLLALVALKRGKSTEEFVVKLSHAGEVYGSIMKSQQGKNIFAFRGIPYAEPPTGELRFKPPVPKRPWQGIPYDATVDGPICVQIDLFAKLLMGQEDCLYLNVYTPKLPNAENDVKNDRDVGKRAVMVFIHGGGFQLGHSSSEMYGPGRILDGDVILVSMNYRLGPLGFLSTGDDASRGNFGLMDQSLALKWVHDNVEAFGGDANRVTIFGESAGAASVGYHLLSPMSSGLFQAAISQSGSPLCTWAFQEEPIYWAKKLGKHFKCSTNSTAHIVDCLRAAPANDIMALGASFTKYFIVPLTFVPTLDGTFLTLDPREAVTSGRVFNKVPLITGVNQEEGISVYAGLRRDHPSLDMSSKKVISEVIKYILDDKGNSDEPSNLIAEKYFATTDVNDEEVSRKSMFRSISDSMFDMCHYETAKLLSQHGFQIYAYSLDYAPSVSFSSLLGLKENLGVGHADDLIFLFDGMPFRLMKPNQDEEKIMEIFLSLWTNFAKFSIPTPNGTKNLPVDWEPSGSEKLKIFHINTHTTTSIYDTSKEELYQFWTQKVVKTLEKTMLRKPKDEL